MRIRAKLQIAALVPALMALFVCIALLFSYHWMDQAKARNGIVRGIINNTNELNSLAAEYMLYHEERPKQQFLEIHGSIARLVTADNWSSEQQQILHAIRNNTTAMKSSFLKIVSNYERNGDDKRNALLTETEDRLAGQIIVKARQVASDATHLGRLIEEEIDAAQEKTNVLVILLVIFTALALTALLTRTMRSITKSLVNLHEGTEIVGSGDLTFRIRDEREDEIGDFSRAFNRMTAELMDVTASKKDLEQEIAGRERAEEALRESEHRYRSLFERMSEGFALHEVICNEEGCPCDYRFLEVNPAFEHQTGLRAANLIGRTLLDVLPESEPFWIERYGRVALSGEPEHFEQWSGALGRWYEVRAFQTEPGHFATVFLDITERKEMEKELRRSKDELEARVVRRTAELAKANEDLQNRNDLLESIFSTVHFLVAYMDADFNFLRVNRAYAEADNHAPEFFPGKNHFDLYPSEENEAIFRKVVESGEPYFVLEKPFEYADHPDWGTTYWDWSLHPVKGGMGGCQGVVLSLVNVTERVKAQQALREHERLLRLVLDTLPLGVWLTDRQGTIIIGNPAGQKIWAGAKYVGIERYGEYKGWWFDTGKKIEPEEWAVARAITRGETSLDEVIEIECFDGTHKIILNSTLPILNEGQIDGAVIVNQDITKRIEMERELRAYTDRLELVNQELQEFAFIASHDLQEPLRKIQSFGDMLRKRCGAELGEAGVSYLLRMEKAAAHMRQLIQDLLRFSRVATRPEPYKTVDLNGVLQEVVQVFEQSLASDGARIEIRDLPLIQADETQMRQLFQNLIGNALKYRRKDAVPEIKVYSKMEDKATCQILVEDNGIGFEQEFAKKIFAPFQRLHTKGEYEGTGMGLAICRKIVERHGGTITAQSIPGEGSTFIISLPIQQMKQGSAS